jgi:hypothetical protein
MQKERAKTQSPATQEYFIRKLAKSGSSRYLSISTILPKDWEAVKIYVENLSPDGCLLKIIPIR